MLRKISRSMLQRQARAWFSQAQAQAQGKEEAKAEEASSSEEIPGQEENSEEIPNFEENQESQQSKVWIWFKRIFKAGFFFALADGAYTAYQQKFDRSLAFAPFEVSPTHPYMIKAVEGASSFYDFVVNPAVTQFLPDRLPVSSELNKKTLVINFENTLYAKDFKTGSGMMIHLRPGFQKFIDTFSQSFDIVLYSDEDTNFMGEVVSTIDPDSRYFLWFYGREFFTWTTEGHKKNLKFVNRDHRKVIVIDYDPNAYTKRTNNLIQLPKYNGEEKDDSLRDLSMLLTYLANPKVKDVRKEIEDLGGSENALANFKERIQKKIEESKGKKQKSFFGSLKK